VATTTTTDIASIIAAELRRGRDAVLDAVPRLSPNYARPDHLPVEVADFFVGVSRGEERRLVFSSAPRFGKTTLNEHGIAWAMFVRPGLKVGVVSCTAFLAEQISRRVRTLLRQLGVHISRDQRALDMWCAANGSSLRAAGVGTALVGVGFDLLVCDDLVPSMAAAQSEAERVHVEEWVESTALGRVEPGGSVLVCMHRWSCDDISGRLIARGWPSVNLPAVCPVTGQSNWPARWSTRQLADKRAEVGPLVWDAMWCGNPSPRGGRVYSALPVFYDPQQVAAELSTRRARIVVGCDPAFTARTSADYSAIVVGVVTPHVREQRFEVKEFLDPLRRVSRTVERTRYVTTHTLDVVEVHRLQVEAPQLLGRLATVVRLWSRYGSVALGVESVGAARAIPQMMRAADPTLRIYEVKRTVDKLTASIPCSAAWHRGEVRWPSSMTPELHAALREVQAFTGTGADAHDDVPDALSIAHQLIGAVERDDLKGRRLRDLARSLPFGT
jgi:phage terminase large subunit-like protein